MIYNIIHGLTRLSVLCRTQSSTNGSFQKLRLMRLVSIESHSQTPSFKNSVISSLSHSQPSGDKASKMLTPLHVSTYYIIMGSALRKVSGHLRTAKAQIRLRIRAVWSEPLLSANRITEDYKMYQFKSNVKMILWGSMGWIWICAIGACSMTPFRLARIICIHEEIKQNHYEITPIQI